MADEVLTSRAGAVLTITLNRPDVYNAFNRAMHHALREALTEAAHAAWSRDRAATAVAGCEVIVRQGDPVVEILKIVREEHVDLLVVGACRGAAAGGNAARSIATRLLERARSAMLTVPV